MAIRLSAFDADQEELDDADSHTPLYLVDKSSNKTISIESQFVTEEKITGATLHRQTVLLALVEQSPGETLQSVAERCGLARQTLYRYMQDPEFQAQLKALRYKWVQFHLTRIDNALIKLALDHGTPGQVSAARAIKQFAGELKDSVEVTGANGGPVQVVSIDPEKMTPEAREMLLNEIKLIGSGETAKASEESE